MYSQTTNRQQSTMQSKLKKSISGKRTLLVYTFIGVFLVGLLVLFLKFPQSTTKPQVRKNFPEYPDRVHEDHKDSARVAEPLPRIQAREDKPITKHMNPVPPVVVTQPPIRVELPHVVDGGVKELGLDTMLLIICANRPEYFQRTLELVAKYHPTGQLPILISQDGDDSRVEKLIGGTILHLQLASPDVEFVHKKFRGSGHYENGYFRLAAHYKFALDEVFSRPEIKRVIILEEDLLIAPDFFEYFAATKHLLDSDTSLLAVSAWNDNGMKQTIRDNKQLYRSDFFPGLGWMMPRRVWEDLGPKWPRAYWDDWLREPKQRQGRQFIRPEFCRTFHIGQKGVSNSQYSEYLNSIRLNEEFVPFTTMDLSYLEADRWKDIFLNQVRAATLISLEDARSGRGMLNAKRNNIAEVKVVYDRFEGPGNSYSKVAAWSGAMDNVKAGVPRTAYMGIVTIWKGDSKVHLVPSTFV